MSVEKLWDELRVGVKCQSNVEIAGSPRNSLPTPVKLRMAVSVTGSQSASDKTRTQEGNSPDRRLRSQMPC